MATNPETERRLVMRCAAFRSALTGEVIETGTFHDILRLPGAFEADLEVWEAGFVDHRGCFFDRAAAAAAAGLCGRLEARAFFSSGWASAPLGQQSGPSRPGATDPTLEAGHLESWRRDPPRRRAA